MINRRNFVLGSAALGGATLAMPRIAYAKAATPKRLLFVLQRGAADGLATLAPMADPALKPLREYLLEPYANAPLIDGMFALHPSFETIGKLVQQKQALFAHAVATSYRSRSHFDGQNIVESGASQAFAMRDGWLNRLLGLLPEGQARALALSAALPLALRGKHTSSSYAPTNLPGADEDLLNRLGKIYESDEQLSMLYAEALKTREIAGDNDMRNLRDAQAVGTLAASLMTGPDSAKVMMVDSDGWDSHAQQPALFKRRAEQLDGLIGSFKEGIGPLWNDTLVLVVTEFGRTAAMNGTRGTDHGTASAMMMLGGTVNGGRVIADWPGLSQSNLYQGRDLKPTQSVEAVTGNAVAQHFGIDPQLAMRTLFPGRNEQPIDGLIRA